MKPPPPHDRLLAIAAAVDAQAAIADRPGQTAELDMLADELRDIAATLTHKREDGMS